MKNLNMFQKILLVVIVYVGSIEVLRAWTIFMFRLIDKVPNVYNTVLKRVRKTLSKKEER